MLSPARDCLPEMPRVPQPGSPEFPTSPYAQMHAHMLRLLSLDTTEVSRLFLKAHGQA